MNIRPRSILWRSDRSRRRTAVLVAALALSPLAAVPTATSADGAATVPQITGTVTAPDGSGLRYVCVDLLTPAGDQVDSDITDASGQYALSDEEPGSYRLRFRDCSDFTDFVSEYYDDAVDLAGSKAITVTATSSTVADAQLAAGGSISGTLTLPTSSASLFACAAAFDTAGRLRATITSRIPKNQQATYRLNSVPVGAVRVGFFQAGDGITCDAPPTTTQRIAPEFYDDQGTLAAAKVLTIAVGQHVTGIDATLDAPGSLPDTVITGGPAQGATVAATGAALTFTGTNAVTGFQCSLDGAAYAACASPAAYNLASGAHTVAVRAVNAAGPDATPATRSFTINRAATPGCTAGVAALNAKIDAYNAAAGVANTFIKKLKKAKKRGLYYAKKRAKKKLAAAEKALAAAQTAVDQATVAKNAAC